MPTTPNAEQLKQQIQILLRNDKRPMNWRAIGFRCPQGWNGGPVVKVGDVDYRVHEARSTLELRQHLRETVKTHSPAVVLVDLQDNQLSDDIRSRLYRHRLYDIDTWALLAEGFKATRTDSRLQGDDRIALALLAHQPAEGFDAVPTGFLDEDTVWRAVLQHVLGLPSGSSSVKDVLAWSLTEQNTHKLRSADPHLIDRAGQWLVTRQQECLAICIKILASQNGPGLLSGSDLLPLGLVCQVIFHPLGAGERDLLQAEVRLEHLVGEKLGSKIGSEWGTAAEAALSLIREEDLPRCRSRANALIKELHAEAHAHLSDVLPLGYEQRLKRFGDALKAVAEGDSKRVGELLSEVRALERHRDGRLPDHRNRKVRMSVRLARWLLESEEVEAPLSLELCAQRYIAELSFVDWARDVLTGGDPVPELQHVYEGLSSKAFQRRERFNRQFVNSLLEWTTAGCQSHGVIPIESALSAVVAPAARSERVLLIVLDGMAWSVAQELLFDLERNYHWTRVQPTTEERSAPWPVLSTVPSVTEFARTSLFSGALVVGDQNEESARFPLHRELRILCTAKYPPILFHKADIEEKTRQGLSPALQKALGNTNNRVIAVVINAVDDHLLKADQTSNTWDVNHIRLLESLLSEARASKRMVVIAADHGHIIDRQTQSVPAQGGGERWQPANRASSDTEIVLGGARVQPYQNEVIVPWSETTRYGAAKRNGYHGGVSPQELIAPCVVLAHLEHQHKDWRAVNRHEPTWWNLEGEYTPAQLAPLPVISRKDEPDLEHPLFSVQSTSASEPVATPSWIARLLASEQFIQRRKSAGRVVPKAEEIGACLVALEAAGGRLATGVLAARINQPEIRIRGFVSSLQRILNVEGYKVVGYSADEGQVVLDLSLLLEQFELKEGE